MENLDPDKYETKGLTFVYASDERHGIGYRGILPWRSPEDLRSFKQYTSEIPEGFNESNKVVMGINTLLSLKQPLPNRTNIVLYDKHYQLNPESKTIASLTEQYKDVIFKEMLEFKQEVLDGLHDCRNTFCIGGANTYKKLEDVCVRLRHTSIPGVYDTDVKYAFPVEQFGFKLVGKEYLETCTVTFYHKPKLGESK